MATKTHCPKQTEGFLREIAGRIASLVTGAIKGRPEKFWDHLAHSRLVSWGRDFAGTHSYLIKNLLEGIRVIDRYGVDRDLKVILATAMGPPKGKPVASTPACDSRERALAVCDRGLSQLNKVTVSRSILVAAPPDSVWGYTQDWRRRAEWDRSVVRAEYLSESQPVSVQVHGVGGLVFKVTYKTSDRPRLTTLAITDLNSVVLKGGGGSWRYEEKNGNTLWTQHNALVLRDGFWGWLLKPVYALILAFTTRQLMKRAKARIERG